VVTCEFSFVNMPPFIEYLPQGRTGCALLAGLKLFFSAAAMPFELVASWPTSGVVSPRRAAEARGRRVSEFRTQRAR